jgi:hypothetical protein
MSYKIIDLRFLRVSGRGVLGALVLGLIITKFQKTCIHTLGGEKINSRLTPIFICFKLCHLKYHQ